jgi:hypothetical protein
MRKRPTVAIEVFIGLMIVVLLHPHDHPVPDKGPDATGMGVVGGTTPGKRTVIPILIVIHPFPRPVGIFPEGIPHFDDRLQRREGQGLIGERNGCDRPGRDL